MRLKLVALSLCAVVYLTGCSTMAKTRLDKFEDGKVTVCGNGFATEQMYLDQALSICGSKAKYVGFNSPIVAHETQSFGKIKVSQPIRSHCQIYQCGA